MKAVLPTSFLVFTITIRVTEGVLRRSTARQQEPDTSCGKGFDSLVEGSKKYFKTAQDALWNHPGQVGQEDTFETELQCWYANMLTSKCGGLPPKSRNAD